MKITSQAELEKNIKLSTITFPEIACKHCKTFFFTPNSKKFLTIMDHFFTRNGKQKINSWYRCPAHHLAEKEKEIGRKLTESEKKSALQSGHVQLVAIDLGGKDPERLFLRAAAFGEFNGIGLYPWGIHIDMKPRRAFWVSQAGKYTYFSSPSDIISRF